MEYTELMINEFSRHYLNDAPQDSSMILNSAAEVLNEMYDDMEKIQFITAILEKCTTLLNEHRRNCSAASPNECGAERAYTVISYQLNKELKQLGFIISEDAFTAEEKESSEIKLNKILSELNEIKMRQHAAYDVILEEIEELRNVYFLGKKNWIQLFTGKFTEMTVSGIISETISKKIISSIQNSVAQGINLIDKQL